jgi:hypothetical protein
MKTIHITRCAKLLTILGLALAVGFMSYMPHQASAATLKPRIIFFDQNPSSASTVTTNPDGSDPQRLLSGIPLKLAPDGSKLIFGRFSGPPIPSPSIYSANADGSNIAKLNDSKTFLTNNMSLQWSPDSQHIYFGGMSHDVGGLYVMRPDGSDLQLLIPVSGISGILDLRLSSDGTKFLITKQGGDYDNVLQGTMDLDGSNQVVTRAQGQPCYEWIWSHDRIHVACLQSNNGQAKGLVVMDADGSNQQLIESEPQNGGAVDAYGYVWSPDDTQLVFREDSQIYVINADGSGRHALPLSDDFVAADWAIMSVPDKASTLAQPTWSANPKTVSQTTTLTVPVTAGTSAVTGGEYYVGTTDPGQGNGTPMSLSGNNLTATFGSNLAPGQYQITVRAKDTNNLWSNTVNTQLTVYENDSQVTGSGRVTPHFHADVMPGLTHNGQFDYADFSLSATKHFGEVESQSNLTFNYKAGLVCFIPFVNVGCHTTNFTTTEISQLSAAGPNNSQMTLQGSGTLTIDGTITTNPFRATVTDGSRLTPTTMDRFKLEVFAPGADPATATPLYHVDQTLQQGSVTITL